MFRKLFTYFLFLYLSVSYSQEPVFKQFTTRDGLPSNEVHFAFSDSKGYMWFCTDAGIARYNAIDFKIFNTSNGLPDNTVFGLVEDANNRIWFRTVTNKIGYISNDSVFDIEADSLIEKFAADGKIISMAFAADGSLYLGRQSSSPCSFLRIKSPFKKGNTELIAGSFLNKCGVDVIKLNNNKIVFTEARNSSYGLTYKIQFYTENFNLQLRDSFSHFETLPITHFYSEEDIIYYASFNNLIKYNLKTKSIERKKEHFSTLAVGAFTDSVLMVGSINNGVWYYDKNKFEKRPNSILKNTSATCFEKDYQGSLWISTLEAGVFYFSSHDVVKYKINNEDESPINIIINDDFNSLVAGHNDGDLKRIEFSYKGDASLINIKRYEITLPEEIGSISGLVPITERNVLVSGIFGNVLLRKDKIVKIIPRSLLKNTIHNWCYKDSKVILCGRSEVYETDTAFTQIKHLGHVNDRISAVCYDGKTLYVSGLNGVHIFDSLSGQFERTDIIRDRVEGMAVRGSSIYFATKSSGIIIKNSSSFDTINETKGLISDFCRDIETNGYDIWVVTNKGLSRITELNQKNYKIDNYHLDYFADLVDIKKIILMNDILFFASGVTIYALHTGLVPATEIIKPLSLYANGKSYPSGLIEFNEPPKNLTVSAEALFYKLKGKINFRYRYNDGDWIYTKQSNIPIGTLSPGDYVIEVEALNAEANWIKAPNKIKFLIKKPFWQSPYFVLTIIIISSTLIGLVLYWLSQRQIRKELLRDKLKIQMIELESKSVRSQMNPHFIFNSLNTLHRFILEENFSNAEHYLTRFSKLLRKLIESSTNDKISLEEEISVIKGYIEIEQLRFSRPFKFELNNEVDESEEVYIPFMLIQPFIENALWHGLMHKKDERELKITFKRLDAYRILCVVEDNGIGRTEATQYRDPLKKKSLAIDFISQRLELLSKVRGVDSYFKIYDKKSEQNENLGTKVEIILPILD